MAGRVGDFGAAAGAWRWIFWRMWREIKRLGISSFMGGRGLGAVGVCLEALDGWSGHGSGGWGSAQLVCVWGRGHLGGRRRSSVAIEVEGWWHRMAGAGVIGMDLVALVARRRRFGVVVWVGQYIGWAA